MRRLCAPSALTLALAVTLLAPLARSAPSARTTRTGGLYSPTDTLRLQKQWQPISLEVVPAHPCLSGDVQVRVMWCQGCALFDRIEQLPTGEQIAWFDINVAADTTERGPCPLTLICPMGMINLGKLVPGSFRAVIAVRVRVHFPDPTQDFVRSGQGLLAFDVVDCGPPPPTGLPFVTRVEFGAATPCGTPAPACAGAPIHVLISGQFPHSCFVLRRVELVDPIFMRYPGPNPPLIRLLFDDQGCLMLPCRMGPVPWATDVTLPPLPAGSYSQIVAAAVVTCADTFPIDPPPAVAAFPLSVAADCAISPLICLEHRWTHPDIASTCDDSLSLTHDASLELSVRSATALAGLQGEIRLEPDAFVNLPVDSLDTHPPWNDGHGPGRGPIRVRNLEAIGLAAGMSLQWTRTPAGARFVLLAVHGAPIPGGNPFPLDVPVLRVTVAELTAPLRIGTGGAAVGPVVARVFADNFLGSDSAGIGVPECAPFCPAMYPVVADMALLCVGTPAASCDMNGDGTPDVRDLVLMVRCVEGSGPCPLPGTANLDCDGNGVFNLRDVLCCGSVILRGHMPGGAPARPEPGISLAFGEPVHTAIGLDVPLDLAGGDLVGAARLAISYPASRFDVAGVSVDGAPPGWLSLRESAPGQVIVGLLQLNPPATTRAGAASVRHAADEQVRVVLHLALRSGASADGFVSLVDAELSGPDGVALATSLGHPEQSLGEPPLGLSAAQPNPFGERTQFAVRLAKPARVELSIHDISGRRVATLFGGVLPAGTRAFSWDGRDAGGNRVARGFYFARLVTDGTTSVRKVVLIGPR